MVVMSAEKIKQLGFFKSLLAHIREASLMMEIGSSLMESHRYFTSCGCSPGGGPERQLPTINHVMNQNVGHYHHWGQGAIPLSPTPPSCEFPSPSVVLELKPLGETALQTSSCFLLKDLTKKWKLLQQRLGKPTGSATEPCCRQVTAITTMLCWKSI